MTFDATAHDHEKRILVQGDKSPRVRHLREGEHRGRVSFTYDGLVTAECLLHPEERVTAGSYEAVVGAWRRLMLPLWLIYEAHHPFGLRPWVR